MYVIEDDFSQVFIVKSMTIQQTSSWISSLPVKKWEEMMKMTVDFKVDLEILILYVTV